jgi:cyanophycinase-like exopeptidase
MSLAANKTAVKTTTTRTKTYVSYFTGDTADVKPATTASLLLVGGGLDRDDAMQWFINRSGKGDIVVLRESGSDGYNTWMLAKGANSVESIVFSSAAAANDPVILDKVRRADGIFFAGGDQQNYLKYFKDTGIETEVNAAAARGVPVGGTSAGLAILGQFSYPAINSSATSAVALANPYDVSVMIAKDFLSFPVLSNVITDSHFVARDRMGRSLTFMARIIKDGLSPSIRGVAVDETVAIGIDENKQGIVFADAAGKAYMLASTQAPVRCEAGVPLTFNNVSVYRIGQGSSFNFNTWTGTNGTAYSLSVNSGVITSTNGSIY